jgi:selenide,water dikinase
MDSFGDGVTFGSDIAEWQRRLLVDPQTSGGLLVSVAPEAADEVLERFWKAGFAYAAKIGRLEHGTPHVEVH